MRGRPGRPGRRHTGTCWRSVGAWICPAKRWVALRIASSRQPVPCELSSSSRSSKLPARACGAPFAILRSRNAGQRAIKEEARSANEKFQSANCELEQVEGGTARPPSGRRQSFCLPADGRSANRQPDPAPAPDPGPGDRRPSEQEHRRRSRHQPAHGRQPSRGHHAQDRLEDPAGPDPHGARRGLSDPDDRGPASPAPGMYE